MINTHYKKKFTLNPIAVLAGLSVCFFFGAGQVDSANSRMRIFIVDSYHPQYLWSQDTAAGVGQALVDFQFLDHSRQVQELNAQFSVESSSAVIKKAWMNTKIQNSKIEIADATARIVNEIKVFKPDIILLGDDNAANYIGNHFMDREIPVVFWGINGVPLKYGLIDSLENPGHNVTGVFQAGYAKECLEFLVQLVPGVKTVAVIGDDSETSRAKMKTLQSRVVREVLPVEIAEAAVTNSFVEWQKLVHEFSQKVDAFVIFNHNTLKDEQGFAVDQMTVGKWYLENIIKPECSDGRQFVDEGLLLVVDDSGFKQGYEAVGYAHEILRKNVPPSKLIVRSLPRGAVIANRQRADQLGLALDHVSFIEEIVETSIALQIQP